MPEPAHCSGCDALVLPSYALFCSRCWRPTDWAAQFLPPIDLLELTAALPCYETLAGLVAEVLGPNWELMLGDENPSYVTVWFTSGFFRKRKQIFAIFQLDLMDEGRIFSNGWEDVRISVRDPRFTEAAVNFSHALNQKIGIKATVSKR